MKTLKTIYVVSFGALLLMTGCSKEVINKVSPHHEKETVEGQTAVIINNNNVNNVYPSYYYPPTNAPTNSGPVVCNPFPGGSNSVNQKWNGIQAKLRYVANGAASCANNLSSFLQASTAVDGTIYFSDINAPTVWFTRGFEKPDGTLLSDPKGKPLLEWFSLHMDAKIRLAPWEKPGLRQFALLSDDGSIMKINEGKGFSDLINNDGLHESKFACSSKAIWVGQEQDLPIHLDYFQGPRHHISLMLLWRTIPDQFGTGEKDSPILDPNSLKDTSCGKIGNDAFFKASSNPENPIPTALWDQVRKNGWEVVPAIDYILPGKNPVNPCYYTSAAY